MHIYESIFYITELYCAQVNHVLNENTLDTQKAHKEHPKDTHRVYDRYL